MSTEYDYVAEDGNLFSESTKLEPEVCLGKTFNSAEERREYYRNELRQYLNDPEFRAIEGFPIGEDEDIIALSDPPYYCACPNPWIPDFIKEWESQKKPSNVPYKREPFAADVSEGKNDPIYMAHTYHTKVPHKAIMKYILHYTNPGDIVFDGFCGTGMTGVAASSCSNSELVLSFGTKNAKNGVRNCIQNDLSSAATFLASNYNSSILPISDYKKLKKKIEQIKNDYKWLYQTKTSNGSDCEINYIIWSDVYICPNCGSEIVFYNEAVSPDNKSIENDFFCPSCKAKVFKKKAERAHETIFDELLGKTVTIGKQVPVQINYSANRKRFYKIPDENDLELLQYINSYSIPHWVPIEELPDGFNTEQPKKSHNFRFIHHFYTKRNLIALALIFSKLESNRERFVFTSIIQNASKMYKFRTDGKGGIVTGTLYIPAISQENNVFNLFLNKIDAMSKASYHHELNSSVISTHSSTSQPIPSASIDYIFLDPPFGANINYSELSFLWETWLKVKTNNKEEAIENDVQQKGIFEYRDLMKSCFSETFRILKPGHWMTVEFSNTDSAVWNAIQTSLAEVGFIVANVSALDKQQGSFKAVTSPTAVKQDLIISLYKPDESFEKQITTSVGTEAVWTFVRKHLEYLPLTKKQGESTITVPERDPRIIYDRMLSYFVGHNMLIPISAPDFLAEMPTRFAERNGLYYLPDQVQEYDKMVFIQLVRVSDSETSLFVCDETSAISWIRAQLKEKPMTLGEMTPMFMQELSSSWTKGEKKPELRELLEQNFLCYDGNGDVPSQVHSYLSTNFKDLRNLSKDNEALKEKGKGRWYIPDPNKAGDLEKIREKALLKEFSLYETSKGKIKEFRIEAIRAGFKKAWQEKNYVLIKSISERMPSNIVEEDEKLLMWYSGALTRLGD